jgi:ABC-type Fe3+/spermidine/putrescine transport system ATPase subunit
MSAGHVEQIGTPQQIYGDPQTIFVARFVGTLNTLAPGAALGALVGQLKLPATGIETWTVRPERLELGQAGAAPPAGAAGLAGSVTKYTYLGREAHVQVATEAGPLIVQLADPGTGAGPGGDGKVSVVVRRESLMGFDAAGRRVATEA